MATLSITNSGGHIGISAQSIVFWYKRGTPVLDDVSFDVPAGCVFGIVGPNGAGKTTLVKILCGLRDPASGAVSYFSDVGGHPIHPKRFRDRLAVVHQATAFDMFLTLEANLLNYVALRKCRCTDYRERVNRLSEALGLSGCLKTPVMQLSGGQMKKAQIMRTMLVDPLLLVMDEPTAGVDTASKRGLWALIGEMRERIGTTVVWTTHDLQEMEQRSEAILVLDKGRVSWIGATSNLSQYCNAECVEIDVDDVEPLMKYLVTRPEVLDTERLSGRRAKIIFECNRSREAIDHVLREFHVSRLLTRNVNLEEAMALMTVAERQLSHRMTRLEGSWA